MISLQGVARTFGEETIFSNVSSIIRPGDKIGLVGANGTGKTTLLRIIAGQLEPDSGTVLRPRYLRVGYLPQECSLSNTGALIEHVQKISEDIENLHHAAKRIEHLMQEISDPTKAEGLALQYAYITERIEHLSGHDLRARAEKILDGLGFPEFRWNEPLMSLSGGWIMRAELARLLLSDPDVLLLDEPTNHLDWPSLMWLETFLLDFKGALIMVSHDREFLNRVVSRIWELDHGSFYEYRGNYDSYREQREERVRHIRAAYHHQQERIRQIEEFIARNRVRKDRAKQVQSRIKMLEKLNPIELPPEDGPINFTFPQPNRCSKHVIELKNISKHYGNVRLYQGLNLTIERGNRIAFIGINGSGKTTLLKIIAGEIPPDEGIRIVGSNVKIGYFAQHRMEMLNPEFTVFEEALSVAQDISQGQVRQILGAFRLGENDVDKKTSVLSGGEKARLCLCKLILEKPNLLLLDEPTNHLDIASRETLEKALQMYEGTMCFVSHDRKFINALATHVCYFADGRVEVFPGNYDDFELVWKTRLTRNETSKEKNNNSFRENTRKKNDHKRLEAERRNTLYRLKKPLLDEISSLEKRIDELHTQMDSIQNMLANPETYRNGAKVQDIQKRYGQIKAELSELTLLWEKKSIKLEELEEEFRLQTEMEVVGKKR